MVDELVLYLNEHHFKSIGLHGDMKQSSRTQVMENYKSGRIHILVATDVAARGIDVENIQAVINYDIPQDDEYYIHRIGRTGRAGKTGKAFTLITNRKQLYWVRDMERFTKSTITEHPIPSLEEITEKRNEKLKRKISIALSEDKTQYWNEFIDVLESEGCPNRQLIAGLLEMLSNRDKKTLPIVKVADQRNNSKNQLETVSKFASTLVVLKRLPPTLLWERLSKTQDFQQVRLAKLISIQNTPSLI